MRHCAPCCCRSSCIPDRTAIRACSTIALRAPVDRVVYKEVEKEVPVDRVVYKEVPVDREVPLIRNKVLLINDQLSQPPSIAIEKIKTFQFSFLINDQLLGRSYRIELFESNKLFSIRKSSINQSTGTVPVPQI